MSRLRSAWLSLRRHLLLNELRRRGATIGDGVEVYGSFFVGNPTALKIGNRVCIMPGAWLQVGAGNTLEIGDDCLINRHTTITVSRRVTVGNRVLIAPCCSIFDFDHRPMARGDAVRDKSVSVVPIAIEDDVWIGANSCVLKGVTIGRGATIGAGSVVTKDVAPYTTAFGNPARVHARHEDRSSMLA